MYLKQGLIMKKIIFSILICTLLSCQENRPHGNQYNLPELTQNNFLIGNLNENRSSYRVSFYDINIDFDIEKKSLNGFVTVKAESIRDLAKLQIDLAENLNIKKLKAENEEKANSLIKIYADGNFTKDELLKLKWVKGMQKVEIIYDNQLLKIPGSFEISADMIKEIKTLNGVKKIDLS